jgi:hypothetical protein
MTLYALVVTSIRWATLLLLAALLGPWLQEPLNAQTDTGRILGNVTDQTGAAVAGASVTITDVERGTTRLMTTTQAGDYVAPNLASGLYKVRVEAKGFRSSERTGVQVSVASDAEIDFTLQPGQTTETVVVTVDSPLIDTTSSTLGGTLSNEEINNLPLNGRNYENLLQLRPGVMRYPGGGFSTTSTNGLRAEDNAYFVDGLFNSEPFSGQSIINGAGIAGDSATILPVDAIQEFNLIMNPPAEYGWKPGSMVNVALKSGTNTLHGTAYAFGRESAMDARNYFNTIASGPKNPHNLEQYGGIAGGPILKNRIFFFGGYEGQMYTVNRSASFRLRPRSHWAETRLPACPMRLQESSPRASHPAFPASRSAAARWGRRSLAMAADSRPITEPVLWARPRLNLDFPMT